MSGSSCTACSTSCSTATSTSSRRSTAYYDEKADHVFADDPIAPDEQRQWFEMRRTLNRFKRIVGPLSQALETMADRDRARFPEPAGPYLRDIAGEIARVAAEVEALRELVGQIVDVNLTLRDYRQNLVMKKVTSWAAIIAVPTLTTGYYGMNVPYPGSGETLGRPSRPPPISARRLRPPSTSPSAARAGSDARAATPRAGASAEELRTCRSVALGGGRRGGRRASRCRGSPTRLGRRASGPGALVDERRDALGGVGDEGVDDGLHVDALGRGDARRSSDRRAAPSISADSSMPSTSATVASRSRRTAAAVAGSDPGPAAAGHARAGRPPGRPGRRRPGPG